MTGNNLNRHNGRESGQVLLIMIMVIATVLTVALTMSFTSRNETQTTKLEEENQKALAAAEASIQVALKKRSNTTLGSGELSGITSFSGGATISPNSSGPTFLSPNIEKDGQYTFYLGAYTAGTPPTFGASTAEDIRICFGVTGSVPALDIALIKAGGAKLIRYAVDPQSRIANAPSGTVGCAGNTTSTNFTNSFTVPGTDIGTDGRLLIVKTLYNSSTLLFTHTSGTALPAQGSSIQSTATSATSGITKKIQLFQSYPQIPVEFFSTIM